MNNIHLPNQQRGVALIVGLIMLLVMTVIGISGMSETIMEEKMIFNFQDRNIAQNSADASLRATEAWLGKQVLKPTPHVKDDCATTPKFPLCGETDNVVWDTGALGSNWATYTWNDWGQYAVEYIGSSTDASKIGDIFAQPRAIIEFRSFNEATTDTDKGIASNLNADKSSQGIGWHFYNMYSASAGYREETIAVIQSTFKKWY